MQYFTSTLTLNRHLNFRVGSKSRMQHVNIDIVVFMILITVKYIVTWTFDYVLVFVVKNS